MLSTHKLMEFEEWAAMRLHYLNSTQADPDDGNIARFWHLMVRAKRASGLFCGVCGKPLNKWYFQACHYTDCPWGIAREPDSQEEVWL